MNWQRIAEKKFFSAWRSLGAASLRICGPSCQGRTAPRPFSQKEKIMKSNNVIDISTNPGRLGRLLMDLHRAGIRTRLDLGFPFMSLVGEQCPSWAEFSKLLEMGFWPKKDLLFFQRHCRRCGGCYLVPDLMGKPLCVACDWPTLMRLYPPIGEGHPEEE